MINLYLLSMGWKNSSTHPDEPEFGKLPKESGIYAYHNHYEDRLLYVGMSKNITNRQRDHHVRKHINEVHDLWFKPLPYEHCASAERELIIKLNPIFNIALKGGK